MKRTPNLDRINAVNDIKDFKPEELNGLAGEIREYIMEVVLKNGGHLGSNLGIIEVTLALHYIFDVEKDLIVWDGSYQTYTHKILTGRKKQFPTLRTQGGMSGFGWKPESEHDPFNFGHVGTALATAHGAAIGDERIGRDRKVVALVGDGSMTSGVAFEALNNIGASQRPVLVILNDNGFSIAKTTGALSTYLNQLRTAPLYKEVKTEISDFLKKVPLGQSLETVLDSVRRGLKQALFPNVFTAFGFQYYGPIDGHDMKGLLRVLKNIRNLEHPVLLHVITEKGKGHPDAATHPFAMHKPPDVKGTFVRTKIREGKIEPEKKTRRKVKARSYTRAFSDALVDLSKEDERIVGITAAMPDGTGILEYGQAFPDRVYDVGISEQCAVAFAAGLAHAGLRPVAAIYSSFSQRAHDQVFQEMCLNRLPVTLVLDRAGVAGEDGPTHHGNYDIASFRPFPNIVLMAPKDETELRDMLQLAVTIDRPSILRIPRESVPDLAPWKLTDRPVELGKGEVLLDGKHGAILAYGVMVDKALRAAALLKEEGLDIAVANARFAKPLDAELAAELVRKYPFVLTLEDHAINGGFGSAVIEALSLRNEDTSKVKIHAIPDRFVQHAEREDLLKLLYLDPHGVADVVRMIAAGGTRESLDKKFRKDIFYGE
jgi:1-deoxy-D-xylulose-5-phosphate synthase